MPLSQSLLNSIEELRKNDPTIQIDERLIEQQLIGSGVAPETATIDDITSSVAKVDSFNNTIPASGNTVAEPSVEKIDFGSSSLDPVTSPTQDQLKVISDASQADDSEFTVVEQETDSAIEYSVDKAQELIGSGIQTFGDLLNWDGLEKFGAEYVEEQKADIAAGRYKSRYNKTGVDTLVEDGAFEYIGWIWEKLQENIASSGIILGGTLAAAATAPISAVLGASIGATSLAAGATLSVGEARQELESQGLYEGNEASAAGTGLIVALLDRFGAGKLAGGYVKGLGQKGLMKQLSTKIAVEAGTEATQELSIMGNAYLQGGTYEVSDVAKRVIDSAVLGGAMGFGVSGVQSVNESVKSKLTGTNSAERAQLATTQKLVAIEEQLKDPEITDKTKEKLNKKAESLEKSLVEIEKEIQSPVDSGKTVVDKAKEAAIDADVVGKSSTSPEEKALTEEEAIEKDVAGSTSQEDNSEQVPDSVETGDNNQQKDPIIIGSERGYSSEARAKRYAGPKVAEGKEVDYVKRDGRWFAQETVEDQAQQDASDKRPIPKLLSDSESATPSDRKKKLGDMHYAAFKKAMEQRSLRGNALASAGDAVISTLEKVPAINFSDAWKRKTRNFLKLKVGNAFDYGLRNTTGDLVSGLVFATELTGNNIRSFNDAVEKSIDRRGLDSNAAQEEREAYSELIDRLVSNDDVKLILKDKTQGMDLENLATSEDGRLKFLIDGIEHTVEKEISPIIAEMIQTNNDVNKGFRQEYLGRIGERLLSEAMDAKEAIAELEGRLSDVVEKQGGYNGLQYSALVAVDEKETWLNRLFPTPESVLDESSDIDPYLIDAIHSYIKSRTTELDVNTNEKIDSSKMTFSEAMVSLVDGISLSDTIEEFHRETNNFYIQEDGTMPIEAVALLGGFDTMKAAKRDARDLIVESDALKRYNAHQDFVAKVEAEDFHVTRTFEMYHGDRTALIESRRRPKTREQQEIRDNYLKELAEPYAELMQIDIDHPDAIAYAENKYESELRVAEGSIDGSDVKRSGISGIEDKTIYGGILLERDNKISEARLAFLGEVTDPISKINVSHNRAMNFIFQNRYSKAVIDDNPTTIFTSRNKALEAGVLNVEKIVLSNPEQGNKLHNMYAIPEIKDQIEILSMFHDDKDTLGGYIHQISGITKQTMTLLAPPVLAANTVDAAGRMSESALLLKGSYKTTIREFIRVADLVKGKSVGEITEEDRRMMQSIAGGSALQDDISKQTAMSSDVIQRFAKWVDGGGAAGLAALRSQIDETMSDAEIQKVLDSQPHLLQLYINTLKGFTIAGDTAVQRLIYKAHKNVAQTELSMNEEQAHEWAVNYVRQTGNYVPFAPPVVKSLQNIPVIAGGFIGWQTGNLYAISGKARMAATYADMFANKWGEENIAGYDPNNKAMFSQAKEGVSLVENKTMQALAAGFSMSLMTPTMYALGISAIVGGATAILSADDELELFDGETEDMIGRLTPHYYRSIDKQIVNVAKDGKSMDFINVTRLGSYGQGVEIWNEVVNSDEPNITKRVASAVGIISSPYTHPTFGLKSLSEAVTGVDEFNRPIYKETDLVASKAIKGIGHIINKTLVSSFFRDTASVVGSLVTDDDWNQFNGNEISVKDYALSIAGAKPIKFDVVKGLQQHAWTLGRARRIESSRFTGSAFGFNPLSDSEARRHVNRIVSANDKFFRGVISKIEAARYFGLTDSEIARSLSSAGVSGYKKPKSGKPEKITGDMRLVLDGKIPAYRFPKQSAKNKIKKFSERSIPSSARNNLIKNIGTIERIINEG